MEKLPTVLIINMMEDFLYDLIYQKFFMFKNLSESRAFYYILLNSHKSNTSNL